MTDKVQKILNEITVRKLCTMDEHMAFYNDKAKEDYRFLSEIEELIKALQEEPVSKQKLSNSFNIGKDYKEEPVSNPTPNEKMSVERWKKACEAACCDINYRSHYGLTETRDDYFVDGVQWADEHPKEEPVSEELDKAAIKFSKGWGEWDYAIPCFKAGAQWQKNHLWKPADGDDLPKIDREVIALIRLDGFFQLPPDEPVELTYKVVFAHRPNPDGWDGKSLTTGNVEHYTPKTYGEGGWNIPDIVYWLDVELPKEIEL